MQTIICWRSILKTNHLFRLNKTVLLGFAIAVFFTSGLGAVEIVKGYSVSSAIAQNQGNYERAEMRIKTGLFLIMKLNTKYPLPVFLGLLSGPIASQGYPERAAQLLGASDTHLKSMGLGLKPSDQPEIDRYEADVRVKLGEGAFKTAWDKGQAMSLEQAIAFALEEDTDNG